MEFYRRIGIADRIRALGYPPEASMDVLIVTKLSDPPLAVLPYPSVAAMREQIEACRDGSLPLEPYQLVSQNDLEPLLLEVAEATPGVAVRYGCELIDFTQSDTGVGSRVRLANGVEAVLYSSYLAGCDGGVSTVRKKLGIGLNGHGRIRNACQVIFGSKNLYEKIPIGKGRHYNFAYPGVETLVVQGSRTEFTLHTSLPPETDFGAVIRDVIGFSCDIDIRHVVPWRYNLLVADYYRDRHVFLAGDAAHLVIPAGGLGMNTGVGDALDLSWKLAGVINGWGGPCLLDSYELERRPVGLRNRNASGWAAASVSTWRKLITPAVREHSPEGELIRSTIAISASVNGRRMHDMRGVELGYSYAGSPLISDEPGNMPEWDTLIYTPHTGPGVRLPHMWLTDGQALHDLLGDGYTFLDLTGRCDAEQLRRAFREHGAPLDVLQLNEVHLRTVYGCSMLLVRPDLHIVWRGDYAPEDPIGLAALATGRQPFDRKTLSQFGLKFTELARTLDEQR
jgi:2-polyprenyl-6-methoxyphenol hydroxylase-like FAD-dependent oxidoreductase